MMEVKSEFLSVKDETDDLCQSFPKVKVHSATRDFVTVSYERTPYTGFQMTATFTEGYPKSRALILTIHASKVVPPGLKKKLEKEMGIVATDASGRYGQVRLVVSHLVAFIDNNKFVPCWKELRQCVEIITGISGSSIKINDANGMIKIRLKSGNYHYFCSILINDGYPNTKQIEDYGTACKLQMESTNFPKKIERSLTTQAKELVRKLQDGMPSEKAYQMSNPIRILETCKDDDKTEDTRDLKDQAEWQMKETARLEAYDFSDYDGRHPLPSLLPLVNFLIEKIQRLHEEACPVCSELSLPEDPIKLLAMYTAQSDAKTEKEKRNRTQARRKRPMRTLCGCWYHHDCLNKFMTEPPFGAECPVKACKGRRVYHPEWPGEIRELEQAWKQKQARQREMDDASDMFF